MNLQPLFGFTAVSLLLLAESVPALAQSASGETAPGSTYDVGRTQASIAEVLFKPSDTGEPPDTREQVPGTIAFVLKMRLTVRIV
ncbi:MAG: hypothetical protein HC832_04425 [Leptolyngbyaceae cyanobacterium RM1_405_57]|nr:hypothetical protein [Leptolyngbyaceae cyanobacterium RM1_405_57]